MREERMSEALAIRDVEDGCIVAVRVHPRAKRNAIGGFNAGALKVSIKAPALDGRANDALIEFLSRWLNVPIMRISLIAGATSRRKTLRIAGKSAAEIEAALVEVC
jgi:uncharacterized protein